MGVKGQITPMPNGASSIFEAIGEGSSDAAAGAVYKLMGWIKPRPSDPTTIASIEGAVVAVSAPNTKPDVELGGMPVGTVGAFVLSSS